MSSACPVLAVLLVLLSGLAVTPAPVLSPQTRAACGEVLAVADETADATLNTFTTTCTNQQYASVSACNQSVRTWRDENQHHSRLTNMDRHPLNTTAVLPVLHAGLVDHVGLVRLIHCTFTRHECPLSGVPPSTNCIQTSTKLAPVDRQSSNYCKGMQNPRDGLVAAYTNIVALERNLAHLMSELQVPTSPAQWAPLVWWTETSEREAYYLLSLYNAHQQAVLVRDHVLTLPECTGL